MLLYNFGKQPRFFCLKNLDFFKEFPTFEIRVNFYRKFAKAFQKTFEEITVDLRTHQLILERRMPFLCHFHEKNVKDYPSGLDYFFMKNGLIGLKRKISLNNVQLGVFETGSLFSKSRKLNVCSKIYKISNLLGFI